MSHLLRPVTDTVESLMARLFAGPGVHPRAEYSRDGRTVGRRTPLARRALQVAVLVGAMVPVAAGAWGVATALGESSTGLSSHARYVSGLLFAIGLGFWSTVPRIERKSGRFRLLTGLVVVGGLCRLAGLAAGDALSLPTGAALVMELCVTPMLCFWQGRTALP